MKKTIGLLLTLALVLSLVAGGAVALAADEPVAKTASADFPKSAITMVIPYGAGGTSDLAGRQFEILCGDANDNPEYVPDEGVIGYDFFNNFTVVIDRVGGEMTFVRN